MIKNDKNDKKSLKNYKINAKTSKKVIYMKRKAKK